MFPGLGDAANLLLDPLRNCLLGGNIRHRDGSHRGLVDLRGSDYPVGSKRAGRRSGRISCLYRDIAWNRAACTHAPLGTARARKDRGGRWRRISRSTRSTFSSRVMHRRFEAIGEAGGSGLPKMAATAGKGISCANACLPGEIGRFWRVPAAESALPDGTFSARLDFQNYPSGLCEWLGRSHIWMVLRGWKMLLRYARRRHPDHPQRYLE